MTTADWALTISLGSLFIALVGFLWNVWSHFIFPKPKVQTSIALMTAIIGQHGQPVVSLTATNHGPIPVTLKVAMIKMRRGNYAVLQPWSNFPQSPAAAVGPFGGGLPKKLDVGEQHSVHFVPDHEGLAADDYTKIGFADTFGRHHWVSKSQLRQARQAVIDYRAGDAAPIEADD